MSHIRAWLGETELTPAEADLDRQPNITWHDDMLDLFELDVDLGMLGALTVQIPAEHLPIPPLVQADGFAAIGSVAELEAQPVGTLVRDAASAWARPRLTEAFVAYQFPCQIVVLGNGVPCAD